MASSRRGSPFPKAGTVCPTCKDEWTKKRKPVQILVNLPVRTQSKKHEIVVCPHCDSDMIPNLKAKNGK